MKRFGPYYRRRKHGPAAGPAASARMRSLSDLARLLGFPPGRHFIVLPAQPRRAALNGLALYDAVYPHQVLAEVALRALLSLRLHPLLRLRHHPPLPPDDWWSSWIEDVVQPLTGPVHTAAFRLLGDDEGEPDRFTCLLFDEAGEPLAFGKVWRNASEAHLLRVLISLEQEPPRSFSVPRRLAFGEHGNRPYLLQRPLPGGRHRRMRPDPAGVRAVIADIQERSMWVPRSSDGQSLVPAHGSLTPLNLRQASDGSLWLVDWDEAGWAPHRYDEIRYWISDLARRPLGSPETNARRILALSRDASSVAEAVRFRSSVRPIEYLPAEQAIRDALEDLLSP